MFLRPNRSFCVVAALTIGCAAPSSDTEPTGPDSPIQDSPVRQGRPQTESAASGAVEATSLSGDELRRPELPADFVELQAGLLGEAQTALENDPDDPDALIWVGRRTAYLGRYRDAIDIYSGGIEQHPGYAALYRHRGHRYLSVRRLDDAITDFSRAAQLVEGQPDEIEPDGLPNARGIPTSTLQSNIFYHLGLAHYLKGDFEAALPAYRTCIEVSPTPDNLVATSHWLYMTLRRLGRDDEAAAALEPITADMDIIENHEYHRLLLMYKGELDPETLWKEISVEGDSLGSATLGYGIGNWFLYQGQGQRERGLQILRQIVDGDQWAAFGYLAAEAELSRLP